MKKQSLLWALIKILRPLNGLLLAAITLLAFRLTGYNWSKGLAFAAPIFITYSFASAWNHFWLGQLANAKNRGQLPQEGLGFYSLVWLGFAVLANAWLSISQGLGAGLIGLSSMVLGLFYPLLQKTLQRKNKAKMVT